MSAGFHLFIFLLVNPKSRFTFFEPPHLKLVEADSLANLYNSKILPITFESPLNQWKFPPDSYPFFPKLKSGSIFFISVITAFAILIDDLYHESLFVKNSSIRLNETSTFVCLAASLIIALCFGIDINDLYVGYVVTFNILSTSFIPINCLKNYD